MTAKSKKVVIVGAGPAGLFAARELTGKVDVILIDEGKEVKERKCKSEKECIRCSTCDKIKGIGGAGLFSDGKIIFETLIGKRAVGSNLSELIGKQEEQKYLIKAREIFQNYGTEIEQEKLEQAREISRTAHINDMDYIYSKQGHVGTDKLPDLIKNIATELKEKGVEIISQETISHIDNNQVYSKQGNNYKYDTLILAPGRAGSSWLEKVLKENQIKYTYRTIDIGIRIETDSEVLRKLVEVNRDVKLSFRRPNGDLIRTFCVCPNGIVTRETYEQGFNLVNGASDSENLTENTNFALLISMPLKYKARSNSYGMSIARVYHEFGTDKPTLQRLGDIKQDRRSKEDKIFEWRIKPTLSDVRVGDIGGGMPYRLERDLLWGIEKLSVSGLMEGLNQESTLLYAPEMKLHGLKIKTDNHLQTTKPNIYVAGDGSGMSRGIGGAVATGLLAAEGILQEIEK